MFLGIKYYTIVYDNCSVLSLVYCDPTRYDALHRQQVMKIAMLLTGNNVSRIIQMFGLPCSCIVMNSLQLYSPKHIF